MWFLLAFYTVKCLNIISPRQLQRKNNKKLSYCCDSQSYCNISTSE